MSGVVLAVVAREASQSAHRRLHESLAALLPAVAVLERGAFAADLRGTRRLLGTPDRVAERALQRAHELGLRCSAGIARTPFVARALAAATPEGAWRLVRPEEERPFLEALPLEALPLDPLVLEELRLLGLRRTGDFAALPRAHVFDRFGRAAARAHALACGEDPEPLALTRPGERIVSRIACEAPIEAVEPLVFALRTTVERLSERLRARGLAVLVLGARLEREDTAPTRPPSPANDGVDVTVSGRARGSPGPAHPLRFERVVLPPASAADALLRSLRWALEERRDLGRVLGIEIEALATEPVRGRQLGLFAPDGARHEDAVAVAAHLRARHGAERVVRARVVAADARLPERHALFEEVAS